jgi:hypothetical protein
MPYYDYNDNTDNSCNTEELQKMKEEMKKSDRGYNAMWRMMPKNNGRMKRTKVEAYTSGCFGSRIRDAETGEFYNHIVGTSDEDLYFSVILATGECNSKNGSSTLFYLSPQHYMKHFNCSLDDKFIAKWQEKRKLKLSEVPTTKQNNLIYVK